MKPGVIPEITMTDKNTKAVGMLKKKHLLQMPKSNPHFCVVQSRIDLCVTLMQQIVKQKQNVSI